MILSERIIDTIAEVRVERSSNSSTYVYRIRSKVPLRSWLTKLLRLGSDDARLFIWRRHRELVDIRIED